MATRTLLGAMVCLALVSLTALMRGDPGAVAEDPLAVLIRQLGDDRFANREAAARQLQALGEKALPALVAATTSKDLEIRRRARWLVRVIMPESRRSRATGMQLLRIVGGEFAMGSPLAEKGRRSDEPLHRVRLNTSFYLGAHEVTQEDYRHVMKSSPSWFASTGAGREKIARLDTSRFPVEQVSWFDAVEFCNRLSRLDGFAAYYRLSEVKREGGSIVRARVVVAGGKGYRLPTEAEWEYACRGGNSHAYHLGRDLRAGDANCKSILVSGGYGGSTAKWRDLGRTARVGTHAANAWGLYDMHGNVAEWCQDWYDRNYYTTAPTDDPPGPATGTHRVQRGGSWLVTETSCRSASRYWQMPSERNYQGGFRVAQNP